MCNPITSFLNIGLGLAVHSVFNTGLTAAQSIAVVGAVIGDAIAITCSIKSSNLLCGQTGWTSIYIGGNWGKVVNDTIATFGASVGIACALSGGVGPACAMLFGYAIYTALSDIFSIIYELFKPIFKGTTSPRAEALTPPAFPMGQSGANKKRPNVFGLPGASPADILGVQLPQ
jgi:hypothetical protein